MQRPRDAVGWKTIRDEIANKIDRIAAKVDISGDGAWVDCLLQCEENPLALALEASPIKPDAAPLFMSSGCTASSSSSGS